MVSNSLTNVKTKTLLKIFVFAGSLAFGDTCQEDGQCSTIGAICNSDCQCPSGQSFDSAGNSCGTQRPSSKLLFLSNYRSSFVNNYLAGEKNVGDVCSQSSQCTALNTECVGGECTCLSGYTGSNGDTECTGKETQTMCQKITHG